VITEKLRKTRPWQPQLVPVAKTFTCQIAKPAAFETFAAMTVDVGARSQKVGLQISNQTRAIT
jgi:hypothetical protein